MRTKLRGNNLVVAWIGTISIVALIAAVVGLIINAFTVKDQTLFAACLTVAAIATSGVSGLAGHLQKEDDVAKQAFIAFKDGVPQVTEEAK